MINETAPKTARLGRKITHLSIVFYFFFFFAIRSEAQDPSLKVYAQVFIRRDKSNYTQTTARKFHRVAVNCSFPRGHYDLGWTFVSSKRTIEKRGIYYLFRVWKYRCSFNALFLFPSRQNTWWKIDTTRVYFESEGTCDEYRCSRWVRNRVRFQ